jgi:hypothetical protein
VILTGDGDLDQRLDQACADGRLTVGDADEVRTFASFLAATAGIPRDPSKATPEQSRRFREAWAEHYPDDYARAVAEHEARQPSTQETP